MRGSWLEQLHGKAISHQLPAKLQLSSHILLSLSFPPLFPTLITLLSPLLCILFLGDRDLDRKNILLLYLLSYVLTVCFF